MKTQESIGRYISCIYRHAQIFFEKELADFDISRGGHVFLLALARNDGIRQEELSQRLKIDKATTARAVKKLMEAGIVERVPDENDGRAFCLYITEKGRQLLPEIRRISQKWTGLLLRNFEEQEHAEVFRILQRLSENAAASRDSL